MWAVVDGATNGGDGGDVCRTLANLQPEEAPPQNTFPPQLTHFGMPNCLLGAYPEDILLMDSLVSLYVVAD